MTDAEMKKLAKLIAEELRSQPLQVETRAEHEIRILHQKARAASQIARDQLYARVPSAQS